MLNPPTYPNFLAFLRHNSIPYLPTTMTFSVSRDLGAFEWAGEGLGGLFCQARNAFNPRMYRMIWDILRFNLFALDLVSRESGGGGKPRNGVVGDTQPEGKEGLEGDFRDESIGEYLEREGYGEGFKEDYLLVRNAIWVATIELIYRTLLFSAHDRRNVRRFFLSRPSPCRSPSFAQMVHAGGQVCARFPSQDPRPLLPQSPPDADHGQAQVADHPGRVVSLSPVLIILSSADHDRHGSTASNTSRA